MKKNLFYILKIIAINSTLIYMFAGEIIWARLYILLPGFILAWLLSGRKNWSINAGFAITIALSIANSVTMTFWGLPFSINFLASAGGKGTIFSEFIARLPFMRFFHVFLVFTVLFTLFLLVEQLMEKKGIYKFFERKNKKYPSLDA